jgi:hypothetical protein
MRSLSPGMMVVIGFVMVILGLVITVLMVIQIIPSTFLLNFIAYAVSFGGLMLGFVGGAFIVLANRARNRDRDRYFDDGIDYDRLHDKDKS